MGNDRLVDIVAAEPGVAIGREHLEDAAAQFEDRDVECAAAEVVNGDLRFLAEALESVGERGGGGLIDDALDGEAGEFARGLGGGALGIVEIRGNGDDGAGDRRLERRLRLRLEMREDQRGDLLRGIFRGRGRRRAPARRAGPSRR